MGCLLDYGADVNALSTECDYGTALLAASARGRTRIVESLLDHGADAHQEASVDTKTLISLLEAWQWGQEREDKSKELRDKLCKRTGARSMAGRQAETAVEVARWMGYESIAQLLISRGAQDLQPVWDKANSEVEEKSSPDSDGEQAEDARSTIEEGESWSSTDDEAWSSKSR